MMNKKPFSYVYMLALVLVVLFTAACPLKVVNVGAPAINCVFDPSCRITVTDSSAPIPIPAEGTNFLQSRTFVGKPGSPANGLYGYEYRIDLRNAVGITYIPCISSMTIEFGPVVSTLDYDGDGSSDQVFVITSGGLGSIGLASADKIGDEITFTFSSPVCAGGRPGEGQSTYFFGLVSTKPPRFVTAKVKETTGTVYNVQARAPQACDIPPYSPSYWNDGGTIQRNNNCYNYANNKRTDTYAQPGRAAGAMYSSLTCADVYNAAIADGLVPLPASGNCPDGRAKIALFVDPGVDYHWYRLDSGGMWSHKPGRAQATNLDNSGNPISNPETADRCGGWLCYTDFCGYLCSCSDEIQGQGHENIN